MRRRLGRARSAIFAGDSRVWKAAAAVAVPLLALIAFYALRPRDYYTGTNSVEPVSYVAVAHAGQPVCLPGLLIPAGTRRLQLQVISAKRERPALRMRLQLPGRTAEVSLPAKRVDASRISHVVFPIGAVGPRTAHATACVVAAGEVNWGGTPLQTPPAIAAPTVAGTPLPSQLSVWYLPRDGAQSSYLARAGSILSRASLFRPGFVGPWLYWLILFGILPVTALLALRLLAIAAADGERPISPRRVGLALFAIAAVNFACWALITPAFQAPDEVDHFAYTQTLVERGEQPAGSPASPLPRWSQSESLLLEDIGFPTDHQVGDSRAPWDKQIQSRYEAAAAQHPSASNGGGYETAATHGPVYYAALAPAYLIASSSPLSQLTLMRLMSALIGALTVLFAFLLGRELAPRRPMLAVLAALLVAFQPMYGFISGAVNNDVGVNAAAAALELLVILIMRRGWRMRLVIPLGLVLIAIPEIKETGLAIYPAVGLALLVALWRHHRRADLAGVGAAALAAGFADLLLTRYKDGLKPASAAVAGGGGAPAVTASSSVSEALAHPLGYLAYLWEVFLPRLSFMAPHFETSSPPAFLIFVERGWGAFGWYVVLFPHWVFVVVFVAMLAVAVMAPVAAWRERLFVRANLPEVGFMLLCTIAVVAGVEAAFYTSGVRPVVAEFGRYAFPAIVPFALIVVGALHAFGRRSVVWLGAGLVTAMIGLSVAGQLLTLTGFYG